MDLVSELVIARGQLEQQVGHTGDRQLHESVAGTARLISDLQALGCQGSHGDTGVDIPYG